MTARLYLRVDEPCEWGGCAAARDARDTYDDPDARCNNCNGDGTRATYTPVPDGSVLLTAEHVVTLAHFLAAARCALPVNWHNPDVTAALEALGAEP